MTISIELTVYDQNGEKFVVPAELIESRFTQHQFAVHKSLCDVFWVVSHVESGGLIAKAETQDDVICTAQSLLKPFTDDDLTLDMRQFNARRGRLQAQ